MSKLLVMALFRDSEKGLLDILSRFESLSGLTQEVEFAFYENDSVDNTRSILSDWVSGRGRLFSEDRGFPRFGSVPDVERLVFMSFYRNQLKRLYGDVDADHVLLVDSDIKFDASHVEQLMSTMSSFTMMTANTRQAEIEDLMYGVSHDSFYDVFALRDRYHNHGLYFTDCPLLLDSDRDLWFRNEPVEVAAAFGGLALIDGNTFNKCKWSTNQNSEHINFCAEVRRHGYIGIDPKCKPISPIDLSSISLEACRQIAQKQVVVRNDVNNVFRASTTDNLVVQ